LPSRGGDVRNAFPRCTVYCIIVYASRRARARISTAEKRNEIFRDACVADRVPTLPENVILPIRVLMIRLSKRQNSRDDAHLRILITFYVTIICIVEKFSFPPPPMSAHASNVLICTRQHVLKSYQLSIINMRFQLFGEMGNSRFVDQSAPVGPK